MKGCIKTEMNAACSVTNGEDVCDVVYVCHTEKDKCLAKKTIDLLHEMGLSEKQIIDPFVEGYSVPLGENKYDFIQQFKYKIFVLYLLTNNTYQDKLCAMDMGATWALKCDYVSIVFPDFCTEIEEEIDPRRIGIDMRNSDMKIKERLGELKQNIEKLFNIHKMSTLRWEEARDGYLAYVKENIERNDKRSKMAGIEHVIATLRGKCIFLTYSSITSLGYDKNICMEIIKTLLEQEYIQKETFGRYRWIK